MTSNGIKLCAALTCTGNTKVPVYFAGPLPGIAASDMRVLGTCHTASDCSPTERRRHVTDGVAKQPKTSSVLLKWVRWGLATAWPRHWPHMKTWPFWVLAADVWLVWHAATSTILEIKTRNQTSECNSCRTANLSTRQQRSSQELDKKVLQQYFNAKIIRSLGMLFSFV